MVTFMFFRDIEKERTIRHGMTNERTNGVTISFLELLIKANDFER
jgi:hypothetical protein